MAAPSPESATVTVLGAEDTSFVCSMPSTRPDGDLYLVCVVHSLATAITPPEELTVVEDVIYSGGTHAMWVGRREGSSEPSSYTFTVDPDDEEFAAVVLRVSGHDSDAPINASSSAEGASATPTCPDITTDVDNCLLVGFTGSDGPRGTTPYEPSGYDARAQQNSSGGGTLAVVVQCATKVLESAGSSGTAAFAISTGDQWVAMHLAIAPAVTATAHWSVAMAQHIRRRRLLV